MNARALIRRALADAHGNNLDAAALLLDRCRDEAFVRALVREFAPQLRDAAPTFSRLLDEGQEGHGDAPNASQALDERLDPRENPGLAETVGEEAAQAFLSVLLEAIREEAGRMKA